MLDQLTLKGRVIAAAMRLAASRRWGKVTLGDIAEEAGSSLVELKQCFSSKADILAAFVRAVDDEVLRRAPKRGADQAARDAIFEVVMSRFDALAPYKAALASVFRDTGFDFGLTASAIASQHWMLQAAGVDTEGARGALRVAGLASVYASVFHVWLNDDDPGLARTMAALDRRLRRGERKLEAMDAVCGAFARFGEALSGRTPARPQQPSPPEPPPSAEPPGNAQPGHA